jgi:hypothetical protein
VSDWRQAERKHQSSEEDHVIRCLPRAPGKSRLWSAHIHFAAKELPRVPHPSCCSALSNLLCHSSLRRWHK